MYLRSPVHNLYVNVVEPRMEMNIWNKVSTKAKISTAIVVLICGSLLYNWYTPSAPPAGVVTVAPVAKAAAHVDTKTVPVEKLVVYDKKQLAKKINLPPKVENDDDEEVTSVSDVQPSKAGVTVTTVVDKKTGITTAYQEPKKQPLFGWGGETRIGADYEIGLKGPAINVHAQYDFIRVGNVYGHVKGEVNTRSEVKGMLGADYVW